jgi:hypothetical protein
MIAITTNNSTSVKPRRLPRDRPRDEIADMESPRPILFDMAKQRIAIAAATI